MRVKERRNRGVGAGEAGPLTSMEVFLSQARKLLGRGYGFSYSSERFCGCDIMPWV